jgi:HK97 family phage portal protein
VSEYIEIAGSGMLRVTTQDDIPVPVQRENDNGWSDAYEATIADFWATLSGAYGASNPTLLERVWVANRCQHMNSNSISTMPLRHFGSSREPAWVSNPDPAWYPNGIADAMYAIVWSMYGWGDAFVLITSRYENGYPSAWTVLDPVPMDVTVRNGRRRYRSGENVLPSSDVVQLTRNPTGGVRGTSALSAYAAYTNGLLAAADLGRVMMASGGTPNAVLKSKKKVNADQAAAIQASWMSKASNRRGAPAVLGPDLEFEQLAFSPADLMLLEAQGFDAQVIATAYGVPAQMINMSIEGGLNYQTPVLMLEQWWRTELRTTAVRIAQGLSANMLPKGQYVEIDARNFLAPSFKEAVEAWKIILAEMGAGSVEEFRAAVLNLPPMEQAEAIQELLTPPSAGASPAQQSPSVVELRPASAGAP